MKLTKFLSIVTVAALAALPFGRVTAADDVVIGVMYPLSGSAAQAGIDAVAALNTALEIINEESSLNLPLAKGKGLPNLGGAKIRIIVADHQGKPDIGQGEAERMITQEGVHAMYGAYYSSVTGAGSQVAERHQIPWVNGESTSPKLTTRGFKWFFRTTPHDGEFTQLMFEFLNEFKDKVGKEIKTVSIFHEDTLWGTDSGAVQNKMAKENGYKVVQKIAYRAKTTSLTPSVQVLKASNADVFLPSSYTSDAMLFMRTAKELDYNPKLLIAQNAGYTDPTFIATLGSDAEGAITRSPFNTDLATTIPLINEVNAAFKKHSNGRDLSDIPVRAFTGFMVLADAINRAGSTDPEKIRKALMETDMKSDQLIVPWKGIKFGPDGQNQLVRGILMQVQNGKYCTVYPFELASCELVYPMPTWEEKAKM
ncbi:MAG: ABC transporter substrate-binding protein [Gammaproteobacteria bacterium]|nr:ABC transporter substrate-binding protein [Gammaproteobacteria bacterium]MDX2462098.1 ABC transporter substrate-binding protein [Gammaproteobacteria bacterium]